MCISEDLKTVLQVIEINRSSFLANVDFFNCIGTVSEENCLSVWDSLSLHMASVTNLVDVY